MWSVPAGERLAEAVRLRDAGLTVLHWDLTDGVFARPGGFTADAARELTARTGLAAEAHLMVTRPLDHVDAWTGFCDLVVVHAEAYGWREAAARVEARGARPGLALSPGTPPTDAPTELDVLVMSITPGHAGARFEDSALRSLRQARSSGLARMVGVDGGVTREAAMRAVAAGADWIVSGTALFGSRDPRAWLASVRRQA
ncbi:hypothetical protein C1I98_22450 [Spongiactinospora gelatinilytica]|uniref:Ribulose-phosphate 3-epimerase n=1 Tax=Spongiactinospora gelatinilytica TaxID=2666298 RepID=A0A2W2GTQ4_9ACTN|nr:hypothetical protein [Spongiactinospora gelatinilytica]PZG40900.1 hypothetical protein C1I98_22450 [Spongiactinospora gelatinilytica]